MSNAMCFNHPNTIATTTCDRCHRPICAADHRRYTRGAGPYAKQFMYCPECYGKAKGGERRWNLIGIILAIIIFSAAGVVFYYIMNNGNF